MTLQNDSPVLYTLAEVANKLQMNPVTVRRMIERGDIRSLNSGKLLRVTKEAFEEYLAGKPQITATPITEIPDNDGEKPDERFTGVSEQGRKECQDIIDNETKLKLQAEYETKTIEAQIQLAQMKNERDKPDRLKQREQDLSDRETEIRKKEIQQAQRQLKLDTDSTEAATKYEAANLYHKTKTKEADDYLVYQREKATKEYMAKMSEANSYFDDKKRAADQLSEQIDDGMKELEELDTRIVEARSKFDEISKKAEVYLGQVKTKTVAHYNTARRNDGAVAVHHDNKANQGWNLQKEIDGLLKWLKTFI